MSPGDLEDCYNKFASEVGLAMNVDSVIMGRRATNWTEGGRPLRI